MASPDTQQKSATQEPSQPADTSPKVAVVNLRESAGFDNEAMTIIVGRNVEAAIETDRGVLVQRKVGNNTIEKTTKRYLLPWANIKSIEYAAPVAPKA